MAQDPWLIVGLGNPGPQYAANRHNAGFMVVDLLASRMGGRFKAHKHRADVVEGRLGTTRAILTKPKTYMNESGGPVAAIRSFFGVPIDHVVVVHDELDLDVGVVRLKFDGGDNGHNGLRSVTKSLGSKGYLRVRIGVGRPPGRMDPAAFVLTDVPAAAREGFRTQLEIAADAVESLLDRGLEATQNAFHQTP
ncbi:MAG TPA: aminoacyl-tRNA hydrolase [Acidothermaceae bacterium]|jgi:PTH1 family peptidyl-tRNA hydrolase|nr:aminoacyl-tRNA hydrolase [Acidothermaceae bacterium]